MRTIYPAIIMLFLAACGAGLSGEAKHALPTNTYEVVIARIFFDFDSKRATFLDLHREATDFLRKEYREFRDDYEKIIPDGALPTIHIQPSDKERSVVLHYSAGLGHRAWTVAFSKSGNISRHTKGVSIDLIDDSKIKGIK